jgi:hypothetical protein
MASAKSTLRSTIHSPGGARRAGALGDREVAEALAPFGTGENANAIVRAAGMRRGHPDRRGVRAPPGPTAHLGPMQSRRVVYARGSMTPTPVTAARLPLRCATSSAQAFAEGAAQALAAADVSASAEHLAEFGLGNDLGFKPVGEMPEIGDEQVDAALLAQTSFPHGTGIVETERSLPDRAESRSLAESTAWATKQKPMGLAQLRSIAATMLSANASGRERNG